MLFCLLSISNASESILPYAVVNSSALQHPSTVMDLYIGLKNRDETMSPVTEVSRRLPLIRSMDPKRPTSIMGILNITPDSFSDGGELSGRDLKARWILQSKIVKTIADGATILDVGGQSTRPNAKLISAEEELERILPVIRTIRKMPEADGVAVSIDTFYSEVAKVAIAEGADLINDISAGQMDPDMLPTLARLGTTIILMHMRGDPSTMTKLTDYPYGVVEGVAQDLSQRFQAALDAGIAPWRIILDPGIGFAKNQDQNLELLRRLRELREHPVNLSGPPWLLGTSRKGFIGKITGVAHPAHRDWGTAATVTASIAGGADIVRVHDVKKLAQVAKMADAIYRS
jgi:2-amino-4-hydroxy-6-hydroxymethyldihydropteridine diphosphokinase / dihydropteroate synthase